ncbi:HNH endonuclease [Aliiroseovarius halocynthiae]|uniref:HNH endonuclease n=1 Tax=Aliiroseovarius halocynthiae TaxID=985055 RepID=A0A545SW28_9RHOB|nr:HNH endonuclease [Aliiroseovarius halocynthiae]TQV69166.1 HNH endonuclease [Aliiroseovarius halocynthiae]SMR71926.1 HNH endonuclease [Aliiroseovarius halocynthiae]
MICIFCLQQKENQCSVEHIIPESLGGGDWAILTPDTVCDSCNHYFGSKIESKVLQDYPLNMLRLFSGVTTKKKKWASIDHPLGKLKASPYDSVIGLDPISEEAENLVLSGKISQFRVVAETKNPLLMCRFLLKVALECVARDTALDAITIKYREPRRFARNPKVGDRWWFMYRYDPNSDGGRNNATSVQIMPFEDAEIANITIFGCNFLVPLSERVVYRAKDELPEPEYRYFEVQQ